MSTRTNDAGAHRHLLARFDPVRAAAEINRHVNKQLLEEKANEQSPATASPGDPRGVPILGAAASAIRGTQPEAALLAKEHRKSRPLR